MGYDCTLHLVDEELLRNELIPRLLAEGSPRSFLDKVMGRTPSWPPTSFDKLRRDAPQLWDEARKALKGDDPSSAARQICELGLLSSSCELPYESARGIALSLWPLEPAPYNPDLPPGLLGSPEEVFGDLVAAYPDLEDEFPNFFDGNCSPGAYIPAARLPSALQWVEAWLATLEKGHRRHYIGLHRVLKVAAQKGYGYWEATDLDVERIESDLLDHRTNHETPTLLVQKHVVTFPAHIGAGRSGSLLAVSDRQGARTAVFDLDTWPPPERARTGQYALSAERSVDGRWAMISAPGGQKRFSFDIRVYDQNLDSPRVLEAQLDGKRIEPKIAGWSGDRAIAFAERNLAVESGGGFTTERPVFLESGDRLAPITTLPSAALPKPGSVFHAAVGTARLGSGMDVLIWDGHGYERRGDTFEKALALDADGGHWRWTFVPAGTTGFYFLSGRRLYESHRGVVPKRCAPFLTNIMEVSEGPVGTLLLKQGENPEGDIGKVYFPSDGSFISISPELIGESAEFMHRFESIYWSEGTGSIILRLGSVLWAIPWMSLRERAQAPKEGEAELVELLFEGPAEWEKLGDCYHDGVKERVLHSWRQQAATPSWKRQSATLTASGSLRFAFTILGDGTLGDSAITSTSGAPTEAAIWTALRDAAPFRRLPDGVSSLRVEATLSVRDAPPVVLPKISEVLADKPQKQKPMGPRQRLKAMRSFLPDGPESLDELQYLFRGAVAERGSLSSVEDIAGHSKSRAAAPDRAELERLFSSAAKRFVQGPIEPMLPARPAVGEPTAAAALDRARRRARETGAFALGQVLARSEASRSDADLEVGRGKLIEQTVRLQMIAEPLEGAEGDPAKLHLEVDELESNTEGTIVQIERSLRRQSTADSDQGERK